MRECKLCVADFSVSAVQRTDFSQKQQYEQSTTTTPLTIDATRIERATL